MGWDCLSATEQTFVNLPDDQEWIWSDDGMTPTVTGADYAGALGLGTYLKFSGDAACSMIFPRLQFKC